jgi:hypothetical protein
MKIPLDSAHFYVKVPKTGEKALRSLLAWQEALLRPIFFLEPGKATHYFNNTNLS